MCGCVGLQKGKCTQSLLERWRSFPQEQKQTRLMVQKIVWIHNLNIILMTLSRVSVSL